MISQDTVVGLTADVLQALEALWFPSENMRNMTVVNSEGVLAAAPPPPSGWHLWMDYMWAFYDPRWRPALVNFAPMWPGEAAAGRLRSLHGELRMWNGILVDWSAWLSFVGHHSGFEEELEQRKKEAGDAVGLLRHWVATLDHCVGRMRREQWAQTGAVGGA